MRPMDQATVRPLSFRDPYGEPEDLSQGSSPIRRSATISFQRTGYHIGSYPYIPPIAADGVVGPQTWHKMRVLLAELHSASGISTSC